MDHVAARQVETEGDLRRTYGLLVALTPHQVRAGEPQLYPRSRMDRVVDAAVAGNKTAEQRAVGRVDDGVRREPGDVSAPEIELLMRSGGRKLARGYGSPALPLRAQIAVLLRKQFRSGGPWRAHVHQRAQKPPLPLRFFGHLHLMVLRVFRLQRANQINPAFFLGHLAPLPRSRSRRRLHSILIIDQAMRFVKYALFGNHGGNAA